MIRPESDYEKALGVRPSVSAISFDRRGRFLLRQRSDGNVWHYVNVCFECAAHGSGHPLKERRA